MTRGPAHELRIALLSPLRSFDPARSEEQIEAQFIAELARARTDSPGTSAVFLPALVLVTFGHHELVPELVTAMPPPDNPLARVGDGLRRILPIPPDLWPSRSPAELLRWYRERAEKLEWIPSEGRYTVRD